MNERQRYAVYCNVMPLDELWSVCMSKWQSGIECELEKSALKKRLK